METLLAILSFAALIGALYVVGRFFTYLQAKREKENHNTEKIANDTTVKKRKEQEAQQALMNMLFEQEYLRKQHLIENLNEEYALGLYDGDIYAIARADDPSAALKKFVKPGLPSVEEYMENLSDLLHVITHGIGLSQDEADQAEEDMLKLQQCIGEKEIATFADATSNLMWGDLAFFNGKVNYLLCVLAMFSSYAKITENDFWENKANEIREKRGYGR